MWRKISVCIRWWYNDVYTLPLTNGFNPDERSDHFKKHGKDFNARTEFEYEFKADRFLGAVKKPTMLDCVRQRGGDTLRFNPSTDEFGIISPKREIKTYFKPSPQIHNQGTNLDYFRKRCAN